jgi:hypothetical protein
MLTVQLLEQQILLEIFNHHATSAIVGAPNTNKKVSTIMLTMQLLKHKTLKKASTFILPVQLLEQKTLKKLGLSC